MKLDVMISESGAFLDPARLKNHYSELSINEINQSLRRTSTFHNGGWELFLDLPSLPVALVIDGGIGTSALALSRLMERVEAIFPDPILARVAGERASSEGRGNVTARSASLSGKLPFEDETFDVVALTGLGDDTSVGRDFPNIAREAERVLKRHGVFTVTGRSREVTPKIFSLLKAGFSLPNGFVIMEEPSRLPYEVRACSSDNAPVERIKNALRFLGPDRHVAIQAKKTGGLRREGIIERILKKLPEPSVDRSGAGRLHFGSFEIYGIQTVRHVLRMPTNEYALGRCRNNRRALVDLARYDITFEAPRFVLEGVEAGQAYFAETKISGKAVDYMNISDEERDVVFKCAQRRLLDLYDVSRKKVILDAARFDRLFAGPLIELGAILSEDARRELEKALPSIRKRIGGRQIDLVMTHGDFKVTNFLMDSPNSISGVIDWDLSMAEGLPFTDLILCRSFDLSIKRRIDIYKAVYETGFERVDELLAQMDPGFKPYIEGGIGLDILGLMAFTGYCLSHPSPQLKMNKEWLRGVSGCFAKACQKIWEKT